MKSSLKRQKGNPDSNPENSLYEGCSIILFVVRQIGKWQSWELLQVSTDVNSLWEVLDILDP